MGVFGGEIGLFRWCFQVRFGLIWGHFVGGLVANLRLLMMDFGVFGGSGGGFWWGLMGWFLLRL